MVHKPHIIKCQGSWYQCHHHYYIISYIQQGQWYFRLNLTLRTKHISWCITQNLSLWSINYCLIVSVLVSLNTLRLQNYSSRRNLLVFVWHYAFILTNKMGLFKLSLFSVISIAWLYFSEELNNESIILSYI